jgi:hypothetical protein
MIVEPLIAVVGAKLVPTTKAEKEFIETHRGMLLLLLKTEFLGAPDTPETAERMRVVMERLFKERKKRRRKVEA